MSAYCWLMLVDANLYVLAKNSVTVCNDVELYWIDALIHIQPLLSFTPNLIGAFTMTDETIMHYEFITMESRGNLWIVARSVVWEHKTKRFEAVFNNKPSALLKWHEWRKD